MRTNVIRSGGKSPEEWGDDPYLEGHRFRISNESKTKIRHVEQVIEDLKKEFPFLLGASFFGSRIIGKEGLDSDLDYILFINANWYVKLGSSEAEKKIKELSGRLRKIGCEEPFSISLLSSGVLKKAAVEICISHLMNSPLVTDGGAHYGLFLFMLSNSPQVLAARMKLMKYIGKYMSHFGIGGSHDDTIAWITIELEKFERGYIAFKKSKKERTYWPYPWVVFRETDTLRDYFSRSLAGALKKKQLSKRPGKKS